MRVFRTTYKDSKGKTHEAAKWYCEFRDTNETIRRIPGFTSKAATAELGRNLEKLVGYAKASGGQSDPALAEWLVQLPQRIRDRLVIIGLLNAERAAVSKPLSDHLDDFRDALKAKACSSSYIALVTGRVRRIVEGCGFRFYGDISASKTMTYLDELRTDTDEKRGISAQTFNFYLQAVKQFCRWMVKDRRATESPVTHLDGLNVATDRRHDRRALSVDELRRLLETTGNEPERFGMTGSLRALLYQLAVESGLRASELRSLTRASFDLDGNPPTVTVAAGYSKRRREDTLPLRPELAEQIRGFVSAMTPGTQAFKVPPSYDTADMFRADLTAAKIDYTDDAGLKADFHCLRHSFISNLAGSGVHPKTAQTLARHSSITLTMDRYSHSYREQEIDALASLPDLSKSARQSAQATGTDCANPTQKNLADCLAQSQRSESTHRGADRQETDRTRRKTSHRPDSNGRPAVYKTAALPTELRWHGLQV